MSGFPKPEIPKANVNPWLIILLTAPIPFVLVTFVLMRWYRENTDLKRTAKYFVERQNSVLAYDAMEVSSGISDLLEKTARDVKLMSLLPRDIASYMKFHQAQMSDYTQFYTSNEPPKDVPLPFYNREMVMSPKGDIVLALVDGKPDPTLKKLADCKPKDLCDRELLEASLKMNVGDQRYGHIMRYYSPEGTDEDSERAGIAIAYRDTNWIYFLEIDFRHLKDHLTTPTFPYEPKRNLLQAYQNGNYIYVLDSEHNIVIHPKHWHQAGIDRATGEWVTPMKTDADEGKHPLSVKPYRGVRLKSYFERLLARSFQQKGVDIFQAPNLGGVSRVLSIAPIFVSKAQYAESGVFGHVIIGCSVEYFEEPSEKAVPYY